ncbi:transposase [Agrobacterium vaccinii]|uniref:transposase n=1 Tax=Agrobacterium vaccinii TaxID=2735528 RepID=UPI001E5B1388|nr:transposase [Agrobacterium vaccinii]UHS63768.1 transposase [Agrobacterium vaccinii]
MPEPQKTKVWRDWRFRFVVSNHLSALSGLTTKIHMLADALGRPLRFIVTAGQVGDITQAPALLEGQTGKAVLADKAYDSNALRAVISTMGDKAVIPSNRSRKVIIPHDEVA